MGDSAEMWGVLAFVSLMYFALAMFVAIRIGTNFDERYRILVAFSAGYLAILGGWRYLEQRQREVDADFMKTRLTACLDSVNAASELEAHYLSVIYGGHPEKQSIATTAAEIQRLYAGSLTMVANQQVLTAMDRFNDVAARDNWGRNLESSTPNAVQFREICLDDAVHDLALACREMISAQGTLQIEPVSATSRSTNVRPEQPRLDYARCVK